MVNIDAVHKQERYLAKDGKRDWVDKSAPVIAKMTGFDAAMFFTIGKYYQRLGKKDTVAKELAKIEDYRRRWTDKLVEFGQDEEYAPVYVSRLIEEAKELAAL